MYFAVFCFLYLYIWNLRPCSHEAGEIWKHSFISAVRPSDHTNLSLNGAFRKLFSNWQNLKTLALRFSVDGKHFENRTLRRRWHHLGFPRPQKWKVTCYCYVFKFLQRSLDWKHLSVSRVKHQFSNSFGIVWTEPEQVQLDNQIKNAIARISIRIKIVINKIYVNSKSLYFITL